jgi:hypothetical protein
MEEAWISFPLEMKCDNSNLNPYLAQNKRRSMDRTTKVNMEKTMMELYQLDPNG